ncbi:MAG: hypothetical protein JWR58_5016 [Pseudonocardia sp.]|nr:hypothetical protein [Pseudonocardia sp.]
MMELVEQAWSAPVAAEQPRRGADQLIHKIRGPRPVLEQDQGRAPPSTGRGCQAFRPRRVGTSITNRTKSLRSPKVSR